MVYRRSVKDCVGHQCLELIDGQWIINWPQVRRNFFFKWNIVNSWLTSLKLNPDSRTSDHNFHSSTNWCSLGEGFSQLNQSSSLSQSLNGALNSGLNMSSAMSSGSYQHYGLNALGSIFYSHWVVRVVWMSFLINFVCVFLVFTRISRMIDFSSQLAWQY